MLAASLVQTICEEHQTSVMEPQEWEGLSVTDFCVNRNEVSQWFIVVTV